MKIQCACGTKVAFDVTPDMAQNPVRFVCPHCGLDSSAMVNQLIIRELSSAPQSATPAPTVSIAPRPVGLSTSTSAEQPPAPTTAPSPVPQPVRVTTSPGEKSSTSAQPRIYIGDKSRAAAAAGDNPRFCSKHPGQRPTERCVVCQKPICPKCMEMFGYVCSPHCQNKAELQGIEVPFYAGKKTSVERKKWRKVGLVIASIAGVIILIFGVMAWYEWFGSRPSVKFSARFDKTAYSGTSVLTPDNQIIFLHGGELGRDDTKTKKQYWSRDLVDHKAVADAAAEMLKRMEKSRAEMIDRTGEGSDIRIPPLDKTIESMERGAAAVLELYVNGRNIWVSQPGKIVLYDWETGEPKQEIPIRGFGVVQRGDELIASTRDDAGQETVTHINLATAATRTELAKGTVGNQRITVPSTPFPAGQKTLDPATVAANASQMSLPEKLALPATLSIQRQQQRALDELNADTKNKPAPATRAEPLENFFTVPGKNGDIQFSTVLLEQKAIAHKAMKDPPKKSALNGETSVTSTLKVANEILNDMQRDKGDTVEEDVSRYLVTIRRPDAPNAPDWRGEVIGSPALFPLNTVTVLTAGKTITVFDRNNKKLWESTLAYPVSEGFAFFNRDDPTSGEGPCVERGDTLYVFDQGVLSAFDLATGNARWRVTSVGISAIFFDDEGNVYANTTTASPENIKYSKQIDVSSRVNSSVMKIEPATGKILWETQPGGEIAYLSGKYIYTYEAYQRDEEAEKDEGDSIYQFAPVNPSHTRIRRINPKNGKVMWEHYQKRGALDVHFDKNVIQLVFKKEIQVLKYLSF